MMVVVVLKISRSAVFILIFLFIFVRVKQVYAIQSISEEFGSLPSSEIWTSVENNGSVEIVDGALKLSAPPGLTFPFVFLNNAANYFGGNFVFESRVKITGPLNFGFGVNLSDILPLNGRTTDLPWSEIIFLIWPGTDGKFSLHSTPCPETDATCVNDTFNKAITSILWGEWLNIKIVREGNIFAVYVDSNLIFRSKPTLKVVSQLWIGNPQRTFTNITWGNLYIDYVRINQPSPTPTVTPSPTPTPTPTPEPSPEPLKPIIVIPGMFASVDYDALLRGTGGDDWHLPTFVVPFYSNLINSLKNAGYQEGNNLFVFAYDWRKRLSNLGIELSNYIDELVAAGKIEQGQKVNLIGHSYGGLVARTFAQNQTDKVNKLILAGSPNKGTVNTYGAWEGGEAWGPSWLKGLLFLVVNRNKLPNETTVDAIRRISPSLQDVLPTIDFLEQNGVFKPVASLSQRNYFLPTLDSAIGSIDSLTSIIRGSGVWTKEAIRVQDRSLEDSLLNRWEDGKPIADSPFVTTEQGDGDVLFTSAGGLFSNKFTVNGNHGDVIAGRFALEKIFEDLGLDPTKVITSGALDTRESALFVGLKSPGTLNVCDPQNICNEDLGIYYPEGEKLFIYPGYSDQDLSISVEAGGETGNYVLETGFVSEQRQNWKETPGSLDNSSEVDSYPLKSLWDTTPPVITPHVNPGQNSEGWNNSNLEVSWEVSDPDSEITASTNCGSTAVSTETNGLEITCSATSYGGSASRSITIKLDKTRPVIIGSASPLPNSHGWNNTDVQVNFVCSEVGAVQSGLAENTVAGGTLVAEALNQSMTSFGNCVDKAGNVAIASSIAGVNIDKTDPVITVNSPSETTYAINAVVNSDWTASDSLSLLDGTENATVPSGGTVDTGSFGIKQFEVTATDLAGNNTTKVILYSVGYWIDNFLKPVSIDGKLFKKGSTIPIKFQLKDAYGRFIPFIDARLLVNGKPAIGSGASSSNNNFRYDFFGQQYIFNLSTKMFSSMPSPYELKVTLNGVLSYSSMIGLR